MNHYVYRIINKINNKKYIGKRSCKCAIKEDSYLGSGTAITKAIKKYGKENFIKEIIEVCSSEKECFEREKYWINYYDAVKSIDYYNIKDGGHGNTREDALRYMKTGKDNPMSKSVLMISLEGSIIKEFECLIEANNYLGKDKTFSYISKRCIKKIGGAYGYMWLFKDDYKEMIKNNTFLDWVSKNSKTTQRAIDATEYRSNKPVYQLDSKSLSILERYKSIQEAKNITGVSITNIIRNCKHGSNTAGGFSWILVEEYNTLTPEELKKLYSVKAKKECSKPKAKRKIVCLTTGETFDGIVDAISYFNLCSGSKISDVCKGIRKSAGKHPETGEPLKWMYYNEYEQILKKCI